MQYIQNNNKAKQRIDTNIHNVESFTKKKMVI